LKTRWAYSSSTALESEAEVTGSDRGVVREGRRRRTRAGAGLRVLTMLAAALAVATVGGLVVLWPHSGSQRHATSHAFGGAMLSAKVVRAVQVRCPGPTAQRCRRLEVRLGEGRDRGTRTAMTLGPVAVTPAFGAGDAVRVQRAELPPGSRRGDRYAFAGGDRRGTLRWLVALFAVLVVVLTGRRGLLALAGFALSLFLIVRFIVPAILAGCDAGGRIVTR
jgi:hypothetical protein